MKRDLIRAFLKAKPKKGVCERGISSSRVLRSSGDTYVYLYQYVDYSGGGLCQGAAYVGYGNGECAVEADIDFESLLSDLGVPASDLASCEFRLEIVSGSAVPFYMYTAGGTYIGSESDRVDDGAIVIDALSLYLSHGEVDVLLFPYDSSAGLMQLEADHSSHSESVADVLVELAVSVTPQRTLYCEGQLFDPTGMVVRARYSLSGWRDITDYQFPSSPLLAGQDSVSLSYQGKTASVAVQVYPRSSLLSTQEESSLWYPGSAEVNLKSGLARIPLSLISVGNGTYLTEVSLDVENPRSGAFESLFFSLGAGIKTNIDQFAFKAGSSWFWIDGFGSLHSFALFDAQGGRYYDESDASCVLEELAAGCRILIGASAILVFRGDGYLVELLDPSVSGARKIISRDVYGRIRSFYDARKENAGVKAESLEFVYAQSGELSQIQRTTQQDGAVEKCSFVYGSGLLRKIGLSAFQGGEWLSGRSFLIERGQAGELSLLIDLESRDFVEILHENGAVKKTIEGFVSGTTPIESLEELEDLLREKEAATFAGLEGNTRRVTGKNGVSILYQWDSDGLPVGSFEVRQSGLWTIERPCGYQVSPPSSESGEAWVPCGESVNAQDAYSADGGGTLFWAFSPAVSSQDGPRGRYFTLEFFLKFGGASLADRVICTAKCERISGASQFFYAWVNKDASGVWQRIRVPIRLDGDLPSPYEGALKISLSLAASNASGSPASLSFCYTHPRLLETDQPDLRIETASALLADSASIIRGLSPLAVAYPSGPAGSGSDLLPEDVVRAVLRPLKNQDGTFDLIVSGGRRRISRVLGLYAQPPGVGVANLLQLTEESPRVSWVTMSAVPSEGFRLEESYRIRQSEGRSFGVVTSKKVRLDSAGLPTGDPELFRTAVLDEYGRAIEEGDGDGRTKFFEHSASGNQTRMWLRGQGGTTFDALSSSFDPASNCLTNEVGGIISERYYSDRFLSRLEQGDLWTDYDRDAQGRAVGFSFSEAGSTSESNSAAYYHGSLFTLSGCGYDHCLLLSSDRSGSSYSFQSDIKWVSSLSGSLSEDYYYRNNDISPSDVISTTKEAATGRPKKQFYNNVEKACFAYRDAPLHLVDDGPIQVRDLYSGKTIQYEYDAYRSRKTMVDGDFTASGSLSAGKAAYSFACLSSYLSVQISRTLAYGALSEEKVEIYTPQGDHMVHKTEYDRDSLGRPWSAVLNNTHSRSVFYHEDGRISTVSYSHSNGGSISESYDYDDSGRLEEMTKGGAVTSFDFDWANRLYRESVQAGSSASSKTYSYEEGRLSRVKDETGSYVSYDYDEEGYLESMSRYSSSDDLLSRESYTYDRYGNLTAKMVDNSPTASFAYTRGRLLDSAVLTGFPIPLQFKYDFAGKRTHKGSTEYFYDDDRLVMEHCAGHWKVFFYDDLGVYGILIDRKFYYLIRNALGDVVGIADESHGIIGKYDYDAWGDLRSLWYATGQEEVVMGNPIRYRGYYFDAETGLYWLGSRYYDPKMRRFLTPDSPDCLDPESASGLDPYAYCCNNPVTYADPSGHFPVALGLLLLGFGIGAGVGAGASVITQGLTKGWGNINGWQVLFDAAIGGLSGAVSFSGFGTFASSLTLAGLGFAGSVGGDLITNNGDWSKVNWAKAGTMAGINLLLGFAAGPGVLNKRRIGEALAKVSVSYRAVLTAAKHGLESASRNTWNLYGGRLMTDIALAVPAIISGRMFNATSVMASTAVAMTLFNWGADSYFDWW